MEIKYKNISLKQMLNILVDCILNKKEPPIFYYRIEFEECNCFGVASQEEFVEITQIDLLDSRFKTIDDDFSEF